MLCVAREMSPTKDERFRSDGGSGFGTNAIAPSRVSVRLPLDVFTKSAAFTFPLQRINRAHCVSFYR